MAAHSCHEERFLKNPWSDYDEELEPFLNSFTLKKGKYLQLNPISGLTIKIQRSIETLYNLISKAYFSHPKKYAYKDCSIYTGITGILFAFQGIGKKVNSSIEKECLGIAKAQLQNLGFLCGISGPLAYESLFGPNKDESLTELLQLQKTSIFLEAPEEFLYGKAGYLFSLLLVKKHYPNDEKINSVIKKVAHTIIDVGKRGSSSLNFQLSYEWHEKEYLGAAHGYAGILSTLLRAKEFLSPEDLNLINLTLSDLLKIRFKSGNFPSSINSRKTDALVHWCHGAPGFIDLLLLSYDVFKEKKYLEACFLCLDVIWERGLLKKGFGLCHGAAGNGYAFLLAYKFTQDPKHLYRAIRFAEYCCNFDNSQCTTPDRPYSLFEGLAGCMLFLHDIQNDISKANFPCYTI